MGSIKIVKKLFLIVLIIFSTNNTQIIACSWLRNSSQWRSSAGGLWFKVVPSYEDSSNIAFNKCTLTSSKEKYDPGGWNYLLNWAIAPHTKRWKYYTCGKHKILWRENYMYDGWSIADTTGTYYQISQFSKLGEKVYCTTENYKDNYKTADFRDSTLIFVERTNYTPIEFDF